MIPPLLLDVQPHHRVLDMCASPGSKTSQIVSMLHREAAAGGPKPTGFVVANDADTKRSYTLAHQLKRLCSPTAMVTVMDARAFPMLVEQVPPDGVRDALRFVQIDRSRHACAHIAECAGACAGVTKDHEGRMFFRPAFPNVRTAGFFAHGDQIVVPHRVLRFLIDRRRRRLDADPLRLALNRIVRAVGLFRMARARFGLVFRAIERVDDRNHGALSVSSCLRGQATNRNAS